jgi:hypothetical protein
METNIAYLSKNSIFLKVFAKHFSSVKNYIKREQDFTIFVGNAILKLERIK